MQNLKRNLCSQRQPVKTLSHPDRQVLCYQPAEWQAVTLYTAKTHNSFQAFMFWGFF